MPQYATIIENARQFLQIIENNFFLKAIFIENFQVPINVIIRARDQPIGTTLMRMRQCLADYLYALVLGYSPPLTSI